MTPTVAAEAIWGATTHLNIAIFSSAGYLHKGSADPAGDFAPSVTRAETHLGHAAMPGISWHLSFVTKNHPLITSGLVGEGLWRNKDSRGWRNNSGNRGNLWEPPWWMDEVLPLWNGFGVLLTALPGAALRRIEMFL